MKLIDKDALVAEIERRIGINETCQKISGANEFYRGTIDEAQELLSFINTLEVKEIDMDFQRFAKEMDFVFALPSSETKNTEEEPLNWEYAIAKHFFELGLKAQKGEKV